jgi:hypothetical protein
MQTSEDEHREINLKTEGAGGLSGVLNPRSAISRTCSILRLASVLLNRTWLPEVAYSH